MNYDSGSIQVLRGLEAIRKRPGMYVGGTDFFGFVNYLVSAYDLMLHNGATAIEVEVGDAIHVTSNANLLIEMDEEGVTAPFETIRVTTNRVQMLPDAAIVAALSAELQVSASDGVTETEIRFHESQRQAFTQRAASADTARLELTFRPDPTIFSVTNVSPAVLQSYSRRSACLFPGVAFRIRQGNEVVEFKSEAGLRDYFDAVTLPYQLVHRPITIHESEGNLKVEAHFAFHSWTEQHIWSFANKGRVPDGGTHVDGLLKAIAQLQQSLNLTQPREPLAVLAIEYPDVKFEGCIKARIDNPELVNAVAQLVSRGIEKWLMAHSAEAQHLQSVETFKFGGLW